jgi:hypothetical protein
MRKDAGRKDLSAESGGNGDVVAEMKQKGDGTTVPFLNDLDEDEEKKEEGSEIAKEADATC